MTIDHFYLNINPETYFGKKKLDKTIINLRDAVIQFIFKNKEEIQKAQDINQATANALRKEFGYGFKGILYGGFMATKDGVKLIEYNARFGDPEAMNVLSILKTDFLDICNGITQGTLNKIDVLFENKATLFRMPL